MNPQRQPEGPYLSIRSLISNRRATMEDDGYSAWLYLSHPFESKVAADCFIYSRVEPTEHVIRPFNKEGPPLLLKQFATSDSVHPCVAQESLVLNFSADGEAAVVLLDGEPWALLTSGNKMGYSKSISTAGPFGFPWDELLYEELFHDSDSS